MADEAMPGSTPLLELGSYANDFRSEEFNRPVAVDPLRLQGNLAVTAASGSGKSAFLLRLVEELILKTSARCIVFDLNSDFGQYDLPAEVVAKRATVAPSSVEAKFVKDWKTRRIFVRTAIRGAEDSSPPPLTPINLPWNFVSTDLLVDEVTWDFGGALYSFHSAVKALIELRSLFDKRAGLVDVQEIVDEVSSLVQSVSTKNPRDAADELAVKLDASVIDRGYPLADIVKAILKKPNPEFQAWLATRVLGHKNTISAAIGTQDVARYYSSKLRSLLFDGIIARGAGSRLAGFTREASTVEVYDLASLRDKPTQMLAAGTKLAYEWSRAADLRDAAITFNAQRLAKSTSVAGKKTTPVKPRRYGESRTPTFIVIDEAHNLLPDGEATGAGREVRELCRRIVAEGRKYNLFLIVLTQRPQKVDQGILAECANLLVMRCDNKDLMGSTALKGRLEEHDLSKCPDLRSGRGLMFGQWALPRSTQGWEGRLVQFVLPRTTMSGASLPERAWRRRLRD